MRRTTDQRTQTNRSHGVRNSPTGNQQVQVLSTAMTHQGEHSIKLPLFSLAYQSGAAEVPRVRKHTTREGQKNSSEDDDEDVDIICFVPSAKVTNYDRWVV